MADVLFPEWSQFLFQPYRYKVAWGGRGSSKSWTFVRALILEAGRGKRILCTREVQKSIRDSVHQLISDQIEAMGLSGTYDITDTEIRAPNGGSFLFAGLSGQTIDSIKSFEGIDRVFCEEAQKISKRSWDVLIPTIRKEGSEIWVAMNPELDTDETWVRLVANPPPNSYVAEVNYKDNPWFPEVLEQERQHCELTAPLDYPNIWLGRCRAAVEGAIYASEVAEAQAKGRICPVPYDPRLTVHTVWDLGWNDSMSIALVQKGQFELRVIGYIQDDHKTLDYYLSTLKDMKLNWGHDWLPHDGGTADFKTGKSTYDLVKKFGRSPKLITKAEGFEMSLEGGIKLARTTFPRVYFDREATKPLVECLKRYRRHINHQHGEPGSPVHDEWSHGADVFRYMAVVADRLTNEDERTSLPTVRFSMLDQEVGY